MAAADTTTAVLSPPAPVTDSMAVPAPPPAAAAAPPSADALQPNLARSLMRQALAEGIESRSTRARAQATPPSVPARTRSAVPGPVPATTSGDTTQGSLSGSLAPPLDTEGAAGVLSDSASEARTAERETLPTAPRPSAPAAAEQAPSVAPSAAATQAPAVAAVVPAAPAPPAALTAVSPPVESAPPPPAAPVAPLSSTALPAEFAGPEWQARFEADPALRRVVRGLLHDPQLSPNQKAIKLAEKVQQAEERVRARQARAQEEERLWEEGDYERLRAQREAQRQDAQLRATWLGQFTEWLADLAEVSPTDQEFQSAGTRGATEAERLADLADWLYGRSPAAQRQIGVALQAQMTAVTAQHAQEIAALQAAHDEQMKALTARLEAQRAADVEETRAQVRAGSGAPLPRAMGAVPAAVAATVPTSQREWRGLLAEGLRMREELQ